MYLREIQGLELAGAANGRSFGRAGLALAPASPRDRWRAGVARRDWTTDLGTAIGSPDWWRGLLTCAGLIATACFLSPGYQALPGWVAAPLAGDERENARALAIAPLGEGADTGRRMAATDLVAPLAEAPERPIQELTATLGEGDAFTAMLSRAGVGTRDAADASTLIAGAVALGDIRPGTRVAMTLGRRADRSVARPLEKLSLRARFDLDLSLTRSGDRLAMLRQPIAIDRTPLRLQGLVGPSLYRAARAAGAPARAVEEYLKALATKLSIGQDVTAGDRFDLVIERARAATGEVQLGRLLLAGLDRGGHRLDLIRWSEGGHEDWFDAAGQIERPGAIGMPVAGHITSGFGMRFHPILGFSRMHKGIDIGAPWGTPVYAVVDGLVASAGWTGGYGNFIKLVHGGALATGYGHLSRIAVGAGQQVRRGQVIGYVGSTGLSTGPHLHWEVWRNGEAINPQSIAFASIARLSGDAMKGFKARVAGLLGVKVGAR